MDWSNRTYTALQERCLAAIDDWRWIVYIILPVDVIGFVACWRGE